MDNRQKEIENLKDYKYGFSTDIENTRAPKGLNEDVIKFISNIKKDLNNLKSQIGKNPNTQKLIIKIYIIIQHQKVWMINQKV
jgi:hypothetical protein